MPKSPLFACGPDTVAIKYIFKSSETNGRATAIGDQIRVNYFPLFLPFARNTTIIRSTPLSDQYLHTTND